MCRYIGSLVLAFLPVLRTLSPDIPAVNLPVGAFLIVLGIAWFFLQGFVLSTGRNMLNTFGLEWLWNDRLMKITHNLAAAIFVVAGISILIQAR